MGVKVYQNNEWVEFSAGGGTGSSGIIVQDEGTTLTNLAGTLNFTGDAVTASGTGSVKTINVSGGSFIGLTDTPQNYTNAANKFVRVNSTGTALEFLTQTPTTGAAGNNKQVQYNDGSTLQGADGLEFIKSGSLESFGLILKPFSTDGSNYGGGMIRAQTKDNPATGFPWNRASLSADGAIELFRTRVVDPTGGPHLDFKSQMGDGDPTPSDDEEDMDARIQMDYALESGSINPNSADYSAITFQTGGKGYHSGTNTNGNVVERLRIGKAGEIGILAGPYLANSTPNTRSDDEKYGQSGYVLTSNGKGNSVSWTSKGTPSGSSFTTPLVVSIPATQPANTVGATVNIADFRSNTGVNKSKLLIYNVRKIANLGWENTTMNIQRQIDDAGANFGYIQFGRGNGLTGTQAGTIHFGTGDGATPASNTVERVEIDPNGYLIAKADIRLRRTASNDGGIYFGDSNSNFIFGEDSVETLTFNSGGTGNFIQDEQITATNGATAYVKSWNSSTYVLTIYNRTDTFVDGNTVSGASASWVIASSGFSSNDSDVLTFVTAGAEKLRITKDGALGLSGLNYGTAGQVLTSGGPNAAPTWGDGGSGGSGSGSSFVLLTEQTIDPADNKTEIEFTGIPADAMEITLLFKGLSANGNNHYVVQLGTSSGYITTGYVGNSENSMGTSHVASNTTDRAGFVIFGDGGGAELHGSMIINKASSNSYTEIGEFRKSNTGGAVSRGSLSSVSGTVDRLKIFLNGTNTFDAGTMSLSYKTSSGGVSTGTTKVAILKDEKDNQVNGGTFQSSGWKDRDLTVKEDPSNLVHSFTATPNGQSTIGSGNTPGYWSLPAGDYKIDWSAPAHEIDRHKTRLVYSTTESQISTAGLDASASFVEGSASHTGTTNVTTQSTGSKIINLSQTTWFKIMHYCSGNNTDGDGFGRRQSSNLNTDTGTNIYTQVRIEDLATAVKDSSGSGSVSKIEQDNTSAEVVDTGTGTDAHFKVLTDNTERLRIDKDGKMGLGTNNPGFQLDVDFTRSTQEGIRILNRATHTSATSMLRFGNDENINGAFLQLNSSAYTSIGGAYNLVLGHGENRDIVFSTYGTEKLRIMGDPGNTFATSDNIKLNNGGGTAENTQVKGVINMGTSYKGGTAYVGSGHHSAVKLFLYKDTSVDNLYGFGVSNGVMEIQSNAHLGFFVGRNIATTASGSRTERMRITTSGHVSINGSTTAERNQSNHELQVYGSFAASSKSFVIDHPTKENHTLTHGSLEGPEHAVYVRGKTSGSVINLPDYWVGLVHDDSITVNLTPIGNKRVWVESINNNSVTVGSDDSTEYFYTIFAERKDIDKITVEVEK